MTASFPGALPVAGAPSDLFNRIYLFDFFKSNLILSGISKKAVK